MKAFTYCNPTEIRFGAGRIAEAGETVARFGKRALLVTGPEPSKLSPLYERIKKELDGAGVNWAHFSGVRPNPTTDLVTAGAKLAKEFGADVVVGIGGGSSMDAAKAIAVEATHPGGAWDYLHFTKGPTEKTLPIIAIPTTAGTGSQTTPCAVITNTAKKDKSAIWHKNIYPRAAIVDPETTFSMPPSVTAQTGFDAFCHNFEAYLSRNGNPLVDAMALDAIRIIARYLPVAVKDGGNREAREQMAWADTLGGLTNASGGVTLPHGLGMQIGGHCPHVSHGQALAILYPAFMRFTCPCAIEKFAAVARIFDPSCASLSDEEAAESCAIALDAFLREIGLWIGFEDFGIGDEQIREIADCGQVLGDYKNNPRIASIDEMYDLMLSCKTRA